MITESERRLVELLTSAKGKGDGVKRILWWFIFNPIDSNNYHPSIWHVQKRRKASSLKCDLGSSFLGYIHDDDRYPDGDDGEWAYWKYWINVYYLNKSFVGCVEYNRQVTRAKVAFDLKLKPWCVIGVQPHGTVYAKTKAMLNELTSAVTTFELQKSLDAEKDEDATDDLTVMFDRVMNSVTRIGRVDLNDVIGFELDVRESRDGWLSNFPSGRAETTAWKVPIVSYLASRDKKRKRW